MLEAGLEASRLLTRRVLSSAPPALALAVDDALGQLRRAGTQPSDLARAGGARATLLADALERTAARLSALGLRDARASARSAASAIAEASVPELEGVARVRVRGVCQWESAELDFIDALHQRLVRAGGQGVVVELPSVSPQLGSVLREAAAVLTARFEQRWAEASEHPEIEFADALTDSALPSIVEAAHEASEARAVARAVLDAVASDTALDRIAIVPVDAAEAFLEPLRAELSAAKLPYSEAWSRPASAAPEAHAALELLRLAMGPLVRDSLVDVLRVPDLELGSLLGERPRPAFVELIARLPVPVDRTGGELLAALGERARRLEPHQEREREALTTAERVLRALFERFARLREPSTRRVFRERARELFAELGLLTASRKGLSLALGYAAQADSAPLGALGQNARAGRAIDLALERVVAAGVALGLADETLVLADFHQEFAAALDAVGPSQGAGRAGTVRIARPTEVAGLDWDLLVVCRAASSSLDWQGSSADSVLDGEAFDRLPTQRRPASSADRALFTRVALAAALSRARRSVITWAKRDARGSSGASRLVLGMAHSPPRIEPASPLDPAAHRVVGLPAASDNARLRVTLELKRQEFFARPDSALDSGNGFAGDLSLWVGGEAARPLALTQLERYARCGFLGFSGIVLRAVRDDRVGDGLSARERGTLIHEALAIALEGSRASFGSRPLEELEREALGRAEQFLRRQVSSSLRGAALDAALEDVAALLRWSFANSDGIWFAEAERGFGHGQPWAALPVGEHFVSGRIDRIDSNSDGSAIRVIDYKTGTVKLTGEHGNQLLQPWLYARKVAQEYGAGRVSSGYLSLQRRKPDWKAAIDEAAPDAAAIDEKLARAEELIISLRGGRVPARPAIGGTCARCDARDICRRPLSAPHEAGE